ncbi:MAG: PASTA domain-containing protein, partial [Actinobacteria bacterium]|nr:PASTA domain-containing protein [Actinomycetota bacterium]
PLTMAAAVAGVANKGVFCTPIAIDRVYVRETKTDLQVPKTVCSQAVSPEVAAGMTKAMQGVINGGTGGASSTGDGTPLAGKTGTTDSGVHTWMTGFSTTVGTAVWVGNVSGDVSLRKILLNNKKGSTVRHDIWRTIMKSADKTYPGGPFDPAPQEMIDATMVEMPSVAGQTADTASASIKTLGLNVKILTKQVSSTQPANTVAYTNPKPGTSIPIGSVIRIYISKGGYTKVPSVKGMTPTDATKALNDAGFPTVSVPQPSQKQFFLHDPNVPAGNVIGTLPAAGKAVNSDSAILLIISTGP